MIRFKMGALYPEAVPISNTFMSGARRSCCSMMAIMVGWLEELRVSPEGLTLRGMALS